jgi:hypothetical protein
MVDQRSGIDYSRWDRFQDEDDGTVPTGAANGSSGGINAVEQQIVREGDRVLLQGLQRSRELNGLPGKIVELLPDGKVRKKETF